MSSKENMKLLEQQLKNKITMYTHFIQGWTENDFPVELKSKGTTIQIDATLKLGILNALETAKQECELMLAIVQAGDSVTDREVLSKMMLNYCINNFECNHTGNCVQEDGTEYSVEGVHDCNSCGCHRTCEECKHNEECPYIFNYEKNDYEKKAIQEKAFLFCSKYAETGYGDKGIGITCRNCVNNCIYAMCGDTFVISEAKLLSMYKKAINKAKQIVNNYDNQTLMNGDMDIF